MAKSIQAREHITARVPPETVKQMAEIISVWKSNIPGTKPSTGDVIANGVEVLHRMLIPRMEEAPTESTASASAPIKI